MVPKTSLLPKTALASLLACLVLPIAVPAYGQSGDGTNNKEGGKLEVLNADKYVGQVKAGYLAAKEIPDICAKLFCYCGCDLTDCHGSLLDCFTSDHGVDCHICQEESILALKFHKAGKSLKDIQKFIDKRYSKEYPFEEESKVLKKYKEERLWDKGKKRSNSENSTSSKAPDQGQQKASAEDNNKRKLDSDSCCGGNQKKQ